MGINWEDVPFIGDRMIEIKAQTLQENLQEVLATRFGVANGRVSRLINSIHQPQKLEVIFRRSLKAKSLDAIVEMLQKAKPPAKRKSEK